MQSYPSEREQTKVNQAYSSLEEILFGLPQGSILDLILFNIFLSDLFLIVQNVDFKSYVVIFSLQESSKKLFKWFAVNQMKTNEDKMSFNCKHKRTY